MKEVSSFEAARVCDFTETTSAGSKVMRVMRVQDLELQ
jgi:hypothetical protein